MTPVLQILVGLLGIVLVTSIIIWARLCQERTPQAAWLDNNTIATTVALTLTVLAAFASAALVVGLIGMQVSTWLAIFGTPVAIALAVNATVFVWRVLRRRRAGRQPRGPEPAPS